MGAQALVGEPVTTAPQCLGQGPLGESLTTRGSRFADQCSVLQQRRLIADKQAVGAPIGYATGPGVLSLVMVGGDDGPG